MLDKYKLDQSELSWTLTSYTNSLAPYTVLLPSLAYSYQVLSHASVFNSCYLWNPQHYLN